MAMNEILLMMYNFVFVVIIWRRIAFKYKA